MRKFKAILIILSLAVTFSLLTANKNSTTYSTLYFSRIANFERVQKELLDFIKTQPALSSTNITSIKSQIEKTRLALKEIDFWLRYLEPVAYKKINGPLPVEWETEVFEKFEKPYKRNGAGLMLAELYLEEHTASKDSLISLLSAAGDAINVFKADSITRSLAKPGHFFFANRLFLLNLAAVYTTGFENPSSENIVPELKHIVASTKEIYQAFSDQYSRDSIYSAYLHLYDSMEHFIAAQDKVSDKFDHFHFIKDFVNPLFALNQQMINAYHVYSLNYNDYTLNNEVNSIFDKNLYKGQNRKGIYIAIDDEKQLDEIRSIGKLLFYDPILSGNGKRSCASCHNPTEYFTDTTERTGLTFNETGRLPRNTPTLINVVYNHLLMLDGKHITLQNQAKDVITNPAEMGCSEKNMVENVLSCEQYKSAFTRFLAFTPNYSEITPDHIVSAITMYYGDFSDYPSPFDDAMNNRGAADEETIRGFNLFMGKAQCATCHFVPQFNGVKPPFISSEFEILGVPSDNTFTKLSADSGRYKINPASETLRAIRTGSIRNSTFTRPYMHNGVFNTMEQVIDFYDAGGGIGKGLKVDHQTLSSDSLHLTAVEKRALIKFIKSLDEHIPLPVAPSALPETTLAAYRNRKVGGEY